MSIANILGTHPPQQNYELLATKKKTAARSPPRHPRPWQFTPADISTVGIRSSWRVRWDVPHLEGPKCQKCHDWTPSARNGVASPWFFGCAVSGAWVEIPEPRAQNGGCFSWKPCLEPGYWGDNHARRAMGKCASCRAISVTGKSLSCEATVG